MSAPLVVQSKLSHEQLMLTTLKETAFSIKEALGTGLGQLYVDTAGGLENTIFLAGSGRSGTTWIAELMNFDNSYRFIFEPLHINRVPLAKPFGWRRYLRPDDDNPELLDSMKTILGGRFRNSWTDHFNRCWIPKKRLVKEIRANLLLGWLHKHFPQVRIVLLLRHP